MAPQNSAHWCLLAPNKRGAMQANGLCKLQLLSLGKNYNPKQTNRRIIATLLASQALVKNNIHDNTVHVKHLAQSLLLL